jgi:hypothetical protein
MKTDIGVKLSAGNRGKTLRAEHTAGGGGGNILVWDVGCDRVEKLPDEELYDLYSSSNVMNVESRHGRVACIGENRNERKIGGET